MVGRGHRLGIAGALGCETLDYTKGDVPAAIAEATENIGPDVVLECAGTAPAIQQAVGMVKKGGRVVIGGLSPEDAPLPLRRFVLDEIEVVGSRAAPNCLPEVLRLVQSGALRLGELVTHRFPVERAAEAYALLDEHPERCLQVLLTYT